jgi:hypothetical protein
MKSKKCVSNYTKTEVRNMNTLTRIGLAAASVTALGLGLSMPALAAETAEMAVAVAGTDTAAPQDNLQPEGSSAPLPCTLGFCGDIYNDDNNQNLRITDDWPNRGSSSTWVTLRPGEESDDYGVEDADGFYIPSGCRGTVAFVQDVGPGWYRVHDHQDIHLTDIVC